MAENRRKQEDLRAQAEQEAELKRKAEKEKIALNVTKNEFVKNALRYAIMRGRQ